MLIRRFRIFFLLLLSSCVTRCQGSMHPSPPTRIGVSIDTSISGLRIYYPPCDSIVLRCFDRPTPRKDPDIVLCCAAAFTLDWKRKRDHKRICSSHVSEGQLFKVPILKRNTGAFVYQSGEWQFMYQENVVSSTFLDIFQEVADNKGAAFSQEMMIHQGKVVKTTRALNNVNLFRALCERNNRLCVVDASSSMRFGDFISLLLDNGFQEALYMDMGPGWNYSWYKESPDSSAVYIHKKYLEAATNWLLFYSATQSL